MAEIHRYDSARLQRPRHRDVGQRTLHSQPAGAHIHSARHTMREAAAEESQRPPSDYAGGHCAHRGGTQKKQNRLQRLTQAYCVYALFTQKTARLPSGVMRNTLFVFHNHGAVVSNLCILQQKMY